MNRSRASYSAAAQRRGYSRPRAPFLGRTAIRGALHKSTVAVSDKADVSWRLVALSRHSNAEARRLRHTRLLFHAMLHCFEPGKVTLEGTRFLPAVLSPLIDAAQRGDPLEPVITSLTRMFGFETFLYGTSLSPRPGQEAVSYVFTTMPRQWVLRYDECGYTEVDPRVLYSFDSAIPFVGTRRASAAGRSQPMRSWMTLPNMALRAASRFQCALPWAVTCSGVQFVSARYRRSAAAGDQPQPGRHGAAWGRTSTRCS